MDQKLSIDQVLENKLFSGGSGEVGEALKFIEDHLTPLSAPQVAGITLLRVLFQKSNNPVFATIAHSVFNMRNYVSGSARLAESLDKVSLYQQLKGMRLNLGGGK